jgi:hypothetical protein
MSEPLWGNIVILLHIKYIVCLAIPHLFTQKKGKHVWKQTCIWMLIESLFEIAKN